METSRNRFSIKKRIQSFKYAFCGIYFAIKTQQNLQIHIFAALVVILLGFVYKLDRIEWSLVTFSIGLVISAELINTAIENLTDLVSPDYNKKAGQIKDIAAGAVLVCAITAALIGLYIFLPRIF